MGPHFISIGEQKAGTSWLYDQLCHHPEFAMPPVKELHYFDQLEQRGEPVRLMRKADVLELKERGLDARIAGPRMKKLGMGDLRRRQAEVFVEALRRPYVADADHSWYRALFSDRGITGDITPGYSSLSTEMIVDIHRLFPSVKLVQLVRDPVARAWSAWRMTVRKRGIDPDKVYNLEKLGRYLNSPKAQGRANPVTNHKQWAAVFGPDAIHVETLDAVIADPDLVRTRFARFLGAKVPNEGWRLPANFNRKDKGPKAPLTDAVRTFLTDFFEMESVQYREFFGEKGDG